MQPRWMSLFTVSSNVWKGPSDNKHAGSPVLSFVRRLLGKGRPPWIAGHVERPSCPKHPSHRWSDRATMRLEGPSTKACQKIPGQPRSVQRAPGRGQDPSPRQSWVGSGSSKVNLLNPLTDLQPHRTLLFPPKSFQSVSKERKKWHWGGF